MKYKNTENISVTGFGGRPGFIARKILPGMCSRLYLAYLRKKVFKTDKKFIEETMKKEIKEPAFIHIETINRCNGTCSFCPCNRNEDKRKFKKMDRDLFMKIIDDLEKHHYKGMLMLNCNCEPFLDDRMPEFIRIVSERLPDAQQLLFSNGTLINDDILEKIAGKIDLLYINNYNDKYQLLESSQKIYEFVIKNKEKFGKTKIQIEYRYANEILTNKGGISPNNRNEKKIYTMRCPNPYLETVIYPDGTVGLCCNDNYEVTNYGNVKDETIFEIFNGEKLNHVRMCMRDGRHGYEFCRYCDFVSKSGRREKWIKTGRESC